jgi:hypothetical protein
LNRSRFALFLFEIEFEWVPISSWESFWHFDQNLWEFAIRQRMPICVNYS